MNCPRCQKEITQAAAFCPFCGTQLSQNTTQTYTKKQKQTLTVLIILLVLVVLAAIMYYTVHNWTPATCTTAQICKICGRTKDTALGHSWESSTCTKPKTCQRCGKTEGVVLGHNWTAATYYSPKTCSNCGQTAGQPLAKQLSNAEVHAIYLGNNLNFYLSSGKKVEGADWEFAQPIEDCISVTVNLDVSNLKDGNIYGEWGFWVHDLEGNWYLAEVFDYTGNTSSKTVAFSQPTSFDRFAVLCHVLGDSWEFGYDIWLSDAWVMR